MLDRSSEGEYRGRIRLGRRRMVAISLAVVAATLAAICWPPERFGNPTLVKLLSPFHAAEELGLDVLTAARGSQRDRIDPRIVIVGIDHDDEVAIRHNWPFPRGVEAKLAQNLVRDGAKLVAFDLLFSGPTDRTDDAALDRVLKGPGNFVLTNRISHGAAGQREKSMEAPYHEDDQNGIDFEAHALSGFADIPVEQGIVRAMTPTQSFQDEWVPSFPLAAYLASKGAASAKIQVTDNALVAGDLKIPRTGATAWDWATNTAIPEVRIDYPAASGAFPMPAELNQIYEGKENRAAFAGKFVFIGLTGSELVKENRESYVTSFSRFNPEGFAHSEIQSETPGVVVQALNFNALLHHTYVRETTGASIWGMVFLVTLGAVAVVRRFPNLVGLACVLGCAGGLFGFSLACLKYRSLHVPWIVPDALILMTAGGVGWLESGSIKRKWAGYVSPAVLNQILSTEGGLAARRYDASVMFGDIRSFTSFSERHSPETVVYLLNRHLEKMTAIISRENGTIDKFLGDGILAVFGAPIQYPASAESAVRAALEMRDAANVPVVDAEGKEHVLATGFGIATGEFLGGDIGSRRLKNWTIIGDVVNLASRLQGVTGQPDVIIDEPTYRRVAGHVRVESLGEVLLKGKAHPVRCYKVLAWSEAPEMRPPEGPPTQMIASGS